MGIFTHRVAVAPPARPRTRGALPESLPALPAGFDAVGEARASGTGSVDECATTGGELGREGVSLGEALEALQDTTWAVLGSPPGFAETRALAVGWSEATLGYLHRLTCEDPVTGLASLAHLQARLTELYRGQLRGRPAVRESHALVVVEAAGDATEGTEPAGGTGSAPSDAFVGDLRAARLAEAARTVFSGDETVGRLRDQRLVVLARRDDRLPQRVALLRSLLEGTEPRVRTWIEGLPPEGGPAAALLGELVRA